MCQPVFFSICPAPKALLLGVVLAIYRHWIVDSIWARRMPVLNNEYDYFLFFLPIQ